MIVIIFYIACNSANTPEFYRRYYIETQDDRICEFCTNIYRSNGVNLDCWCVEKCPFSMMCFKIINRPLYDHNRDGTRVQVHGLYKNGYGLVTTYPDRFYMHVAATVAHEIGHDLGLTHTSECKNLMSNESTCKYLRVKLNDEQKEQIQVEND